MWLGYTYPVLRIVGRTCTYYNVARAKYDINVRITTQVVLYRPHNGHVVAINWNWHVYHPASDWCFYTILLSHTNAWSHPIFHCRPIRLTFRIYLMGNNSRNVLLRSIFVFYKITDKLKKIMLILQSRNICHVNAIFVTTKMSC